MTDIDYREHENWYQYESQRKYCINLLRKTKLKVLQKLKIKRTTDYKTLCKTTKPNFRDEESSSGKITSLQNNTILTEEKKIAETLNNYFINIAKTI